MHVLRRFEYEWEFRALMHPGALNMLLTVYSGPEGSRNLLLIATKISLFAEGPGEDRIRFRHTEQISVAFIYRDGMWHWGDDQDQCYYPTIGQGSELPPLEYVDCCTLFTPAEVARRKAGGNWR